MSLRVYIVSFPFNLHSAGVFDSHTPCRARAMPQPCRSESDFSRPCHRAAWAWHGMCELQSAIQRRHVGDMPAFGFFQLPRGVSRSLLQNHTNPLICRTSSSDISGYRADFQEGHGTVGEWQGRGMACVNQTLPHCVNQIGKTRSKHLSARHGRRTALAPLWHVRWSGVRTVRRR
jgi:hypothetical protein